MHRKSNDLFWDLYALKDQGWQPAKNVIVKIEIIQIQHEQKWKLHRLVNVRVRCLNGCANNLNKLLKLVDKNKITATNTVYRNGKFSNKIIRWSGIKVFDNKTQNSNFWAVETEFKLFIPHGIKAYKWVFKHIYKLY